MSNDVLRRSAARKKPLEPAAAIHTTRKEAGKEAFKRAFPPLSGEENIRGFIACVTQAMILDFFWKDEGTKLLYAAQVAHTACKRPVLPTRSPGRPHRESTQPVSAPTALSNQNNYPFDIGAFEYFLDKQLFL